MVRHRLRTGSRKLGRKIGVQAELARASGEALPFRDASFDFVFSRVALPYMDISVAVAEMHRVLRPGGELWLTLHPMSMLSWTKALGSPKRTVFEAYRLANTASLHFLGKQFRYPLRRQRTESYQTSEGMRRLLARQGFENIHTQQDRHFLVTAQKRG
ncbi:MAG: class I SAM-dependent methyltransferase [Acidobacteriota bacterium]